MSKIKNIEAREIVDSRGKPTVEVELETERGTYIDSCPSGASTGANEALELRDAEGPDGGRADGRGGLTAIKNVNEIIAPKLKGKDPSNQKEIDDLMIALDGTENKSKLGANAILPVSMAVCRAGAAAKKLPLYKHIAELAENKSALMCPLPSFNLLEGGVHTDDETDTVTQEFMLVPQKKTFVENLVLCNKIFENLRNILEKNFGKDKLSVGFEGGFATPMHRTEQALFSLKGAIGKEDCKIALDIAASEFYKDGKYSLDGRELIRAELLEFYEDLVRRFPIISIEDPFAQEEWQGFEEIMQKLGSMIIIVGDDLTTTNVKRIKEAQNKKACNGVILKLNQIGTVSETIEAFNLSKSFGWKTVVSHRSGETMDDFIADLAVGAGADFLKAGSPAKPERMVKYTRLLQIEQELKHV